MGRRNLVFGKMGENLALRFLSKRGYRIIGRNFKSVFGEVDLIAVKEDCVIFIEVKTRTPGSFGPPYLSVTREKFRHIVRSALCYLSMKDALGCRWRIDIVSVEIAADKRVKNIELLENVFEED